MRTRVRRTERGGNRGAPKSHLRRPEPIFGTNVCGASAKILVGDVAEAVVIRAGGVRRAEEPVVPTAAGEEIGGVVVTDGVGRERA